MCHGFETTKISLVNITKIYESKCEEIRVVREKMEGLDTSSYNMSLDLERLQRQYDDLKQEHEKLVETTLEIKKDNDNLNEMIITLKRELNRMDDVISESKRDNDRHTKNNSDLRIANDKLLADIVHLKKDIEDLKFYEDELKRDLDHSRRDIDTVKRENEKLASALLTEQGETHCLLSDLDQFKYDYDRLDKHHKETVALLEDANKKVHDLELELKNTMNEKRISEQELSSKHCMYEDLKSELFNNSQ